MEEIMKADYQRVVNYLKLYSTDKEKINSYMYQNGDEVDIKTCIEMLRGYVIFIV